MTDIALVLRWGALPMMVLFSSAELWCQQGHALSARHSQEHAANTERAATADAESLYWRCASLSWVPQAVLTFSNTYLRENQVKTGLCSLYLCSEPCCCHALWMAVSLLPPVSLKAIWSPAPLSIFTLSQFQMVRSCRVNFSNMKCGFGLHFHLHWKRDRRLSVFCCVLGFWFCRILGMFPPVLCYSLSF